MVVDWQTSWLLVRVYTVGIFGLWDAGTRVRSSLWAPEWKDRNRPAGIAIFFVLVSVVCFNYVLVLATLYKIILPGQGYPGALLRPD